MIFMLCTYYVYKVILKFYLKSVTLLTMYHVKLSMQSRIHISSVNLYYYGPMFRDQKTMAYMNHLTPD